MITFEQHRAALRKAADAGDMEAGPGSGREAAGAVSVPAPAGGVL